jgi:hypothetical protein
MIKWIKWFIAKIFRIDNYFDVAYDLIYENELLRETAADSFYKGYLQGKEDLRKEIEEQEQRELEDFCAQEEIDIDDLVDITGEHYEAD